jgi:endogenous inhibitor of DNA gyrase (YacG/DUF329 family)
VLQLERERAVAQRLTCPTCRRAIEWSEQFPQRPFCSERCRLIDLGAWLSEQHAIPGDPAAGPSDPAPGESEPREP